MLKDPKSEKCAADVVGNVKVISAKPSKSHRPEPFRLLAAHPVEFEGHADFVSVCDGLDPAKADARDGSLPGR